MVTYSTPGVYIEEIAKFPPSIVSVATAVPAFVGYTETAEDESENDLTNVPTRITSLLEFETYFGMPPIQSLSVDVEETIVAATQQVIATEVSYNGTPPSMPSHFLYYSVRMYFDNGGGPCYIVSIGDFGAGFDPVHFIDSADPEKGITTLEKYDEPTLLVFPDACLGNAEQLKTVVNSALALCNKMQDRFVIADVRNAIPDPLLTNDQVTNQVSAEFRGITIDIDQLKYGAAYFPYLNTSLPFFTTDDEIKVFVHTINSIQADGSSETIVNTKPYDPLDDTDPRNEQYTLIEEGTAISDSTVKTAKNNVYHSIKAFISANATVTLPPSGAVAGVYARVDNSRGVWKAPANTSVINVVGPALTITNDLNGGLNIDPDSGKSINAIRAFTGKGTLVWGARTLAGNDNEWRYVPVRRFFNMVEESVKKTTARFVFEPNDANTWVKVRSMIESFLTLQWRAGALAGAKPDEAFYVKVGLDQTMSAQDILDGNLIVEIGMAVVRPAEFIILRFSHKMQES